MNEEDFDVLDEELARSSERSRGRDTERIISRMTTEIQTLRKRLGLIEELSAIDLKIQPRPLGADKTRRQATAVFALSDLHVEEKVRPQTVNGLNIYDLEIANRGLLDLERGFQWLLGMSRHRFTVGNVFVWIGGDTFTGHIHEDCVETAQLSPTHAIAWLAERLIGALHRLALDPKTDTIDVGCDVGNHGRTTDKPRVSTAVEHSFEWLLYYMLATHFHGHPKVRVRVPVAKMHFVDIDGWVLRTHHGDDIGYQGGVGGITIPMNKAIAQWDKARKADHSLFGHWHQYLSNQNFTVNGSAIGWSPYASRVKASYEPPQQAFFLVDHSRGKCLSTPIWVSRRQTDIDAYMETLAEEVASGSNKAPNPNGGWRTLYDKIKKGRTK